jgi:hypothetical protein
MTMPNEWQIQSIERVKRILASEDHFRETDDSPLQQLRDILTDIRHYAEDNQLDFYVAVDGSYIVYLEEREAE